MATATRDNIAGLYVATFNRAPDAAGLNYWAGTGMSIEDIAQSFFDQTETQTLYPTGTSTTSFVTAVYQNLFNRAPDQAGLDYWVHELDTHTVANQNFILAVTNGALATDATILQNKKTVGLSFADAGLDDVTLARNIMANVDGTLASVTAAETIATQSVAINTPLAFTNEWLADKTLYQVILDTEDDNNNGSTSDHIVIAMKYENSKRLIDFNVSDGINNFIDTGSYSITNGALKVNDIDGDFETDAIVSINSAVMTTTSSYSWNKPSQATNWYFDINDAWLGQLGKTKMFSAEFFASVGVTYSIFKDNNQWIAESDLFSNGKVYEAAGLTSGSSLTLTGTYTIMTDGSISERRSSNGDIWQDKILAVTDSYIIIYDPTSPNWSNNDLAYIFLDSEKAQIALNQLQINGVISGDLSLI